ncbi:hypothetical protein VTJ83DRAFT_717 [Remersonia thermophila]|uniref:Heterokaryon incompatibility domain-containing protein n=1 Tax=Remersonia thermophila TaxID=72144 RepID=A0ABR4DMD6_9PEZI
MRLINVKTRKIAEFISDAHVEPYAILSHTWDEDEVSFEDYQTLPTEVLEKKKGYAKIDYCCKQAEKDGYAWAWVDTCCIDKRSSAELSEAINSMFRWYQQAAVCYAFLVDVEPLKQGDGGDDIDLATLERARWFTRGWTLQELLAPRELEFYARSWTAFGSRSRLGAMLSKITNIPEEYLSGELPLARASVAKRMSWASNRKTTRIEDVAYCLLGIFDVNMPLLYGEGKRAFRRLQEEILKANPMDHTIFAWGQFVVTELAQDIVEAMREPVIMPVPWLGEYAERGLVGLFANSPEDFRDSAAMVPWRGAEGFSDSHTPGAPGGAAYPSVSGSNVVLTGPAFKQFGHGVFHWPQLKITQLRRVKLAVLLVEDMRVMNGHLGWNVILPLYGWGHNSYGRMKQIFLSRIPFAFGLNSLLQRSCLVQVGPRVQPELRPGDFVIRRWGETWHREVTLQVHRGRGMMLVHEGIIMLGTTSTWDLRGESDLWSISFRLMPGEMDKIPDGDNAPQLGFGIIFTRKPASCKTGWGPDVSLKVSMVRLVLEERENDWFSDEGRHRWRTRRRLYRKMERESECEISAPRGTFQLDHEPFPLIRVDVERMAIGPKESDFIDVVDIMILEQSEENRLKLLRGFRVEE